MKGIDIFMSLLRRFNQTANTTLVVQVPKKKTRALHVYIPHYMNVGSTNTFHKNYQENHKKNIIPLDINHV